ncbi:MAG: hypothetical protein WKF37_11700, partial [Bryobacteraceae bacterium]
MARDGSIYAAASGLKVPGAVILPPAIAPLPTSSPLLPVARPPVVQPLPSPQLAPAPASVSGSEVYRIGKDGYPQRVWNHLQDTVYAIGFDASGLPLLGTGNKGGIYRLDSERTSTLLTRQEPSQVTAVLNGGRGALYAATANTGKIYKIGPELERQGSYESEALDAASFSFWGKAQLGGGSDVALETRSGNLTGLRRTGCMGSAGCSRPNCLAAGKISTVRISMKSGAGELREVAVAYMGKHCAGYSGEITPANFKHSAALSLVPSARTLTLPALGQRRPTPQLSLEGLTSSASSLQFSKGFTGARWAANDVNGDQLISKLEIRGLQESVWKLLQDKVREKQFSWDS